MKDEISYKQYKEALLIVDIFHDQINKKCDNIYDKENKTDLKSWTAQTDMGGRLRNVLSKLTIERKYIHKTEPDPPAFEYLEDVTKERFLKERNAGEKTWEDFEELREFKKHFTL